MPKLVISKVKFLPCLYCRIMTIIVRIANAKAATVPGGFREDVLHVLTDFVALVNDMPQTNPPGQVPLDTPKYKDIC